MSYAVVIYLNCDVCFRSSDTAEWTVAETRRSARRDGWHHHKGRDLCSTCWAQGER